MTPEFRDAIRACNSTAPATEGYSVTRSTRLIAVAAVAWLGGLATVLADEKPAPVSGAPAAAISAAPRTTAFPHACFGSAQPLCRREDAANRAAAPAPVADHGIRLGCGAAAAGCAPVASLQRGYGR